MGIKWVTEPPGSESPRDEWVGVAAELRQHPGKWALVVTKSTPPKAGNVAMNIRRGGYTAFQPHGAFEAAARGCEVYARYVG